MLKYIISLIIFLAPFTGIAQDSLAVQPSKIAVSLYADIGKLGESLFENQTKWEFGVSILLFGNYNFVGEYGYGSLYPKSVINNGSYTSEGNYYRAGFEYVFTILPKTTLSTGAMYAHADFKDYGIVSIESELWDDINETFERDDLKADWVELIVNTEAPIIKAEKGFLSNFYWGVRFRLRILVSDISQPTYDIFGIPGYGKTYSTVVPAANLYLKYKIGF